MTTAKEDQDAIAAAIQVAAANDLVRLDSFAKTGMPVFTALSANLNRLAGQMSLSDNTDRILAIQASIDQALGDFNTVFSITTDNS